MRLGMIGLGTMGLNMTRRLIARGHEVVAYDLDERAVRDAAADGAESAASLDEVIGALAPPRTVWLMVPAGVPTRETIAQLAELLEPGDLVVDGGNSRYTDSLDDAALLSSGGIAFCDVGVSGGRWGLEEGYCLMVGAEEEVFSRLEPVWAALAPEDGYARVGGVGAGHFTKMVHNGIEYGMLQAYGEGFELLAAADEFALDLGQLAELWRHGSVIRSWLLDLLARALEEDPNLETIAGYVDDSGEGRWTVVEAVNRAVPVPGIATALFARFASRQDDSFSAKVIAALRQQFGDHEVQRE